ncbi:uncharacterized protein LOC115622908 isoform X1 [Scaptodrosophila lebanonensis]|uniref:Uncharacterized protein LOC115622908 isoform X1 n=1 Tax=Drosophila lebanonensis TaxID=7225 RepID=A0A6J2T7I2_DROLE|nr:uncharacterized protein LOC115622908 isoform X1 [Scaptodrosophila lebanonensis]
MNQSAANCLLRQCRQFFVQPFRLKHEKQSIEVSKIVTCITDLIAKCGCFSRTTNQSRASDVKDDPTEQPYPIDSHGKELANMRKGGRRLRITMNPVKHSFSRERLRIESCKLLGPRIQISARKERKGDAASGPQTEQPIPMESYRRHKRPQQRPQKPPTPNPNNRKSRR